MSEPEISTQLIVFGERNRNDFPAVLRQVREAGFPAFEGGNLFASQGEEAVRALLQETGLKVSGAHFGYGDYADQQKLTGHIAYAQALGIKNLLCSGVAEGTVEGYRQSAGTFNKAGKILKEAGIRFSYHNHDWEFKKLEGETIGMDILLQETDPAMVGFNFDVFWLYYAGQDPAAYLRAHAGRATYLHFKDGRAVTDAEGKRHPHFTELGRGEVDLKAALAAARETGAEWIVAEQDHTELDPAEAAAISCAYLHSLGL